MSLTIPVQTRRFQSILKGRVLSTFAGEKLTVTLTKLDGATESMGGGAPLYISPSYSLFAYDADGNEVRIFGHLRPGRRWRAFIKAAEEMAADLAAHGLG